MNTQFMTYSNTFLLTRDQILQRRTARNTQLLIKIYDSWGVTYVTIIRFLKKTGFNIYNT